MSSTGEYVPGVTVSVGDLVKTRSSVSGQHLRRLRVTAADGTGPRQTRIRGRGMDYEETRAYIAGDDVRTMDWRVTARTGEAHTKVFAEEKQRNVLLAVDLSYSMFFGTREALKSWAAAHAAAHIGWLAVSERDHVGGLIASGAAHHEVRPSQGHTGLLRIFQYLEQEANPGLPMPSGAYRLNFVLEELRRVARPGTLVVLISDFLGLDNDTRDLMSAIARHNDVLMIWVHDDLETKSWPSGSYRIRTKDRDAVLDLSTPGGHRWLAALQSSHFENVHRIAARFRFALCPLSCNLNVGSQIRAALS